MSSLVALYGCSFFYFLPLPSISHSSCFGGFLVEPISCKNGNEISRLINQFSEKKNKYIHKTVSIFSFMLLLFLFHINGLISKFYEIGKNRNALLSFFSLLVYAWVSFFFRTKTKKKFWVTEELENKPLKNLFMLKAIFFLSSPKKWGGLVVSVILEWERKRIFYLWI